MIASLKNFTTMMLCTILLMTLIKMLLPEGKNKKYILFVCGVITTFILLEPLLQFTHLDIQEVFAQSEKEYQAIQADDRLYQETLQKSYETALIEEITQRLKESGYSVSNVRVEYDTVTFQPQRVYLYLEDEEGYVQPVRIEVANQLTDNSIPEEIKNHIQEILQRNYGFEKKNIFLERSN